MKLLNKLFLMLLVVTIPALTRGETHPFTFDDMMKIVRVGDFDVSPDGRWVVYAGATADVAANKIHSAIYIVAADGRREPRKLADGSSPVFSPEGHQIAFLTAGDAPQLALISPGGGEAHPITKLAEGAGNPRWSPTGSFLVFQSDAFPQCADEACNARLQEAMDKNPVKGRVIGRLLFRHWNAWKDGKRTHIFRVNADGSGLQDLTPGDFDSPSFGNDGGFDISPDGRWLAYESNHDKVEATSTNGDIWLVSTAGGQAKNLTFFNPAYDGTPKFSPDGKWIAYRSQRRAGFESDKFELRLYSLRGETSRSLTENFPDWIDDFSWAPGGHDIYFTSNVEGYEPIYRVALRNDRIERIVAGIGATAAPVFPRHGGEVFFAASAIVRPNSIFRTDDRGRHVEEVTRVNDPLFAGVAMPKVESRWFTSTDGHRIQAWLLTPPGFDPAKKYPAIFMIHGGPQGAWGNDWSYRWNLAVWACRGYVLYAPNPRGSTGYGQKFVDEISGDWGGQVYQDLMKGADDLESLPSVDTSRVGAAGASFGGFMIDWIEGHTDRFKALFCHDGVFDQPAMFGSTEELWFPVWEMKGYPWTSDLYQKWNPAAFAGNFKTPMLICHSEKDFRIPYAQGLELFTDLQIRGVASRLIVFPNECHFVLQPADSRLWHEEVFNWFHDYLGGDTGPEGTEPYSVTK